MMRLTGKVCLGLVALALTGVAKAETLEEVEKKIATAAEKVKSYTAKSEQLTEMSMGDQYKMKSESKGTYEYMRKDDKHLMRMESKGVTITKIGDQPEKKINQKSTVVSDGEYMTTLTEGDDDQKQAIKMKADKAAYNPKAIFDSMRKDYDLKLMPDEKVDGKDCWLVEATPKKEEPGSPVGKIRMWFRKDLGMTVKNVVLDKKGKPTTTVTMTDIKTDVDIKPERFKLEIPKGVEVMDMTKMQTSRPAEESTEPDEKPAEETKKTEPAKKEEPKKEEPKKEDKVKGLFNKLR